MSKKSDQNLNYIFRQATEGDYDLARKIVRESFLEMIERIYGFWDESVFRKNFHSEQLQFIMLKGVEIGVLETETREADKELYVVNLQLLPAYRNKGIGRDVLEKLYLQAKNQKLKLTLSVYKINFGAQKFYSKIGFVTCGETKTHYQLIKN